jgi:isocitrate dehydrogenase
MTNPTPITVARGDGIGPEIMEASLQIMQAAGANLEIEEVRIGQAEYLSGNKTGIEPKAWESLRRTGIFFKAPLTTPQGGGYKSVNVTLRKAFGLYTNIRPVVSYHPFVHTKHPRIDLVIIRENEEDLYAGIEHRQTQEVYQTLKLITRPGSERIIRYAFEYARLNNRKKVTCFTKDNIMKMTDGLFHKVYDEIGAEYPDIEKEHWIIDIGAAKVATEPETFDVIVMPNLYGDVVSDITAQLTGSVGLAGSANIGLDVAMFEAIHGSAPDIAGLGIANPSGLLLSGVLLLIQIKQYEAAERIHNAWLKTLEDGIHTGDIYRKEISTRRVNTAEFTQAVIDRIGQRPEIFAPISYGEKDAGLPAASPAIYRQPIKKELVGTDLFLDWDEKGRNPDKLAEILETIRIDGLSLEMITNRGVKVWPNGAPETFCTDHWRCRYQVNIEAGETVKHQKLIDLLQQVTDLGLDFIKIENLYTFDGELGFSLGQGQ